MVHVCYITLGIETVSFPFFCYRWQGCMWIEKERKRILFNALPAKFNKILWLVFHDDICLISSLKLYRSGVCMGKGTFISNDL